MADKAAESGLVETAANWKKTFLLQKSLATRHGIGHISRFTIPEEWIWR